MAANLFQISERARLFLVLEELRADIKLLEKKVDQLSYARVVEGEESVELLWPEEIPLPMSTLEELWLFESRLVEDAVFKKTVVSYFCPCFSACIILCD